MTEIPDLERSAMHDTQSKADESKVSMVTSVAHPEMEKGQSELCGVSFLATENSPSIEHYP